MEIFFVYKEINLAVEAELHREEMNLIKISSIAPTLFSRKRNSLSSTRVANLISEAPQDSLANRAGRLFQSTSRKRRGFVLSVKTLSKTYTSFPVKYVCGIRLHGLPFRFHLRFVCRLDERAERKSCLSFRGRAPLSASLGEKYLMRADPRSARRFSEFLDYGLDRRLLVTADVA